jgi:hypothetical protein
MDEQEKEAIEQREKLDNEVVEGEIESPVEVEPSNEDADTSVLEETPEMKVAELQDDGVTPSESESSEALDSEQTPEMKVVELQDDGVTPSESESNEALDSEQTPVGEAENNKEVEDDEGFSTESAKLEEGRPAPPGEESANASKDEKKSLEAHIEIPKEIKIKFDKKFIAVAAAVIIVIIAAFIVIPEVTATPQDLLEQGKYEKAYQKADDEDKPEIFTAILDEGEYEIALSLAGDDAKLQVRALGCAIGKGEFEWALANAPTDELKTQVLVANAVATALPEIQEGAKDSKSVRLSEGYYLYDSSQSGSLQDALIMKISGANTYGQTVQNYYVSTYGSGAYEYYTNVTSLSQETIYKYLDTTAEKVEKALKNLVRTYISDALKDSDTVELPSAFVDGINTLIEDDRVDEVVLITGGSVSKGGSNT